MVEEEKIIADCVSISATFSQHYLAYRKIEIWFPESEKYMRQNQRNTEKKKQISLSESRHQHYLASPIPLDVRYIGHQCSKYLIQI